MPAKLRDKKGASLLSLWFTSFKVKPALHILGIWFFSSLLLLGITQLRYLLVREKAFSYRQGDQVVSDLVLFSDLSFVDEEATKKVAAFNQELAPPVYMVRGEITNEILRHFDEFAKMYQRYLGEELPDVKEQILAALILEHPPLSRIFIQETPASRRLEELIPEIRDLLSTLLYAGIFRLDLEDGGAASGIIEVIYADTAPERRLSIARGAVTTIEGLDDRMEVEIQNRRWEGVDKDLLMAFTKYFAAPNGLFNQKMTLENRREAAGSTQAVTVFLPSGTLLLAQGGTVTAAQERALEALRRQGGAPKIRDIFFPFYVTATLFILGLLAFRFFQLSLGPRKNQVLFGVSCVLYLLTSSSLLVFLAFPHMLLAAVVLPTALFTLVLDQLLQDRKMAFIISGLMAMLMLFLVDSAPFVGLYTLAAGIIGTTAVGRRATRMGLLRSGPRLALFLMLTALVLGFINDMPLSQILLAGGLAAFSGMASGILSLAFLPLLEHLLNTATTFRLIELSDQNVPVLKKMRLRAPGTYIHSHNVAHLAEAACEVIGADGLLARVGSYYHDIGKIDQAPYFVENQKGNNRHDDLKATLSAAVIKSHVKIGLEKARELHLPDEVLAIISQHHGTSVIRYFYDRAVKEKGESSISPDDFSYGGPRPQSREAAVVMLADSAEAATRTLKNPTAAKLEKYVWTLIMHRFKAGELNDSDLTLRDLESIKKAFCQVLTGHFHSRIEYPKEKEEDSGSTP